MRPFLSFERQERVFRLKYQFETSSKPTINRNWWFRWILVRRFRTISISIDRAWFQNWLFIKVLFYCLNSRWARGCFSGSVCESVFSDVDSDELEFIVNEEMQQYQIIHEQVIIQQNKEMNEIIGEGFHHKMTPCRTHWFPFDDNSFQILKKVRPMVKPTGTQKYGALILVLKAMDQVLLLLTRLT